MLAINPPVIERVLRDYQQEAIDRLRDSLRSGYRRPMLQSPTGSGKTLVAATLVNMALAKGKRVAFVVPSLSLISQTIEAFAAEGIYDVGIQQANHMMTDHSRPVQICSIQTIARRGYPSADMVICDEAHKIFEAYGRWFTDPAWARIPFIGLSATPWTKGLGKLYDTLIVLSTTAEMVEAGYLSPFRVYAAAHPDLKGVRTVAGDYHEGELSIAMNKATLVGDVVNTWLKYAEDRPTLCFAVDRAHAQHLQKQFEAAGVPTAYQDMNSTPNERNEIKRKFHKGEIKVVTSCETMIVGVDWDVRCVSFVRPTKSEILYCQAIGRGLRTAEGKQDCLILDHSDTTLRLGFVTDIHHEKLHDGRKQVSDEKRVALPKECPECSYLRPPRVSVCPNCGFKPERAPLQHAKGELVELRPGVGKKPKRAKAMAWVDQKPKGELYGELMAYAFLQGRKPPGWIAHAYKELIGVWPPKAFQDLPRMPVSSDVERWIRSRNIKWAKGQRA